MPGFEHGYKRAVSEIIGGIVTSAMLNAFILTEVIDSSWVLYFKLLNMFGLITLILAMPYWGTIYLLGWLIGLFILSKSGLVGFLDFVIYFGIPLMILFIRLIKKFEEF